jgi:hypothetical protein
VHDLFVASWPQVARNRIALGGVCAPELGVNVASSNPKLVTRDKSPSEPIESQNLDVRKSIYISR